MFNKELLMCLHQFFQIKTQTLPTDGVKELNHQLVFALCVWSACFPPLL